jgi:glycosyltransferase involved in cell wall biosynthesis
MSQAQVPVRVSVITPFLNAELFLREAIESVLAQSYGAWKLLLVDDGSTDGSTAIAQRYADQYPQKICYLHHEERRNRGSSASLNLGMKQARGEYIALLDSDDLWEPQRLEKQVAYLDAHQAVVLLGSWYSLIDAQSTCIGTMRVPCEYREIRWGLFFANQFANSAVMLRREPMLSQVGLHNENYFYAKDYDLWCRIADRFPVANLPEYLTRYRVHAASMTAGLTRSETESNRLRCIYLAPLLSWNQRSIDNTETLTAAMADLYYGWAESLDASVLSHAVEEMLRLHARFFGSEGCSVEEIEQSERALHSRIAANLVMLTVFCSSADLAPRRRLLASAWHLEPHVFLQALPLARAGRALAAAFIPRLRMAPSEGGLPEPIRQT